MITQTIITNAHANRHVIRTAGHFAGFPISACNLFALTTALCMQEAWAASAWNSQHKKIVCHIFNLKITSARICGAEGCNDRRTMPMITVCAEQVYNEADAGAFRALSYAPKAAWVCHWSNSVSSSCTSRHGVNMLQSRCAGDIPINCKLVQPELVAMT